MEKVKMIKTKHGEEKLQLYNSVNGFTDVYMHE